MIIPVFVPHYGCPHDCVFCNQEKITGRKESMDTDAISDHIDEYLSTMQNREESTIEIAFYGGSFTAIDGEIQEIFLKVAYTYVMNNQVDSIRLSTRPDAISKTVLARLKKYGVESIELGVQSMDIDVLKESERGHLVSDVEDASRMIKSEGFRLGLQMMVGLPGDTLAKTVRTAQAIVNLEPDFVRIYPTLVIRNTKLEQLYLNDLYKPLTLKEAVEWSAYAYREFCNTGVPVIRIGLQPTTELEDGTTVVAGPYHPSFRQMVDGWLFKSCICSFLNSLSNSFKTLELTVNPKMRSALMGIRKQVINEIKEMYRIESLIITESREIDENHIQIKTDVTEEVLLKRF